MYSISQLGPCDVFQRGLLIDVINVDILFLLKYFSLRRISFGRGEPPLYTLSKFSLTAGRRSKFSPAAHLLRRAAVQIFRRRRTRATGGCAGFQPAASAASAGQAGTLRMGSLHSVHACGH
jgi:hypothetical protein